MTGTNEKYLELVYGAQSNEDLSKAYDGWADSYDEDLENFGYRVPALVTCLTARYVPPDEGVVLDAGAGTGQIGEWLHLAGYRNIVGIDLSDGMIAAAERRNVYQYLRQMILGETLDFSDNSFRAVVSAGVFNASHAPSSSFDELVRITQPSGHLIFSVKQQDIEAAGFRSKFDELEARKCWREVEICGPFLPMLKEPEVTASVFVFQVNS